MNFVNYYKRIWMHIFTKFSIEPIHCFSFPILIKSYMSPFILKENKTETIEYRVSKMVGIRQSHWHEQSDLWTQIWQRFEFRFMQWEIWHLTERKNDSQLNSYCRWKSLDYTIINMGDTVYSGYDTLKKNTVPLIIISIIDKLWQI